jgi:hypothetical protein
VSSERQPERHPHVHLHAPLRPAHRRPAHRRRCRALREVRQPALIGVGAERPPRAAPRLRSPVPSSVPHTPPHPGAASRFSRLGVETAPLALAEPAPERADRCQPHKAPSSSRARNPKASRISGGTANALPVIRGLTCFKSLNAERPCGGGGCGCGKPI